MYEKRADKNIEAQREALRNLPVYIFSASFAKGHDELDEYRASFRANVECKNAIEEAEPTLPPVPVVSRQEQLAKAEEINEDTVAWLLSFSRPRH